jgi:hypothetical protein
MSTPVVYPTSLPTPSAAPIRAHERRLRSTGRPFQVRTIQRDYGADQQITFPPMTLVQATALRDWGEGDLNDWGNWFASTWASPQGGTLVRRWLGPPSFDYIPGSSGSGYWQVIGACEVRGAGELPVLREAPLWQLLFQNNLDDEQGHLFEADNVVSDGGANSFGFTTSAPLPGSTYAGRFPGTNNHIRSETFPNLQLAAFDWQVDGFFKLRDVASGIGGPILRTGSLQTGGNTVGPLPAAGQFSLAVSNVGLFTLARSTSIGATSITSTGNPNPPSVDDWWHYRITCDATSMRLHAGEVSGGVSVKVAEMLGARPYAGAYDDLQRFFIGCTYDGGIPPLEVYIGRFHGDMSQTRFLEFVTDTADSFAIPAYPFPSLI